MNNLVIKSIVGVSMKKIVLILLICLFSFQSIATCVDKYKSSKVGHYLYQMEDSTQSVINLGSGITGLVMGTSILGFTVVGGFAMLAIASAPIMVGEAIQGIKNKKENRALRLIRQATEHVNGGKARGLFKRVTKKIIKNNTATNSMDIALAIVKGNDDMTLCQGDNGVREIKRAQIDGNLIIVE
jgi:hypothetical protein